MYEAVEVFVNIFQAFAITFYLIKCLVFRDTAYVYLSICPGRIFLPLLMRLILHSLSTDMPRLLAIEDSVSPFLTL